MLLKELTYIFRPNLIHYINISKVLDNYMSRCKCTGGNSMGGIGLVGDISFSLKNISSFMKLHKMLSTMRRSAKHRNHKSGLHTLEVIAL